MPKLYVFDSEADENIFPPFSILNGDQDIVRPLFKKFIWRFFEGDEEWLAIEATWDFRDAFPDQDLTVFWYNMGRGDYDTYMFEGSPDQVLERMRPELEMARIMQP